MADPKCPACSVAGMEHIISKESAERSKTKQPWFLVVHCDQCGHIYGVMAKHTFSQPVTPKLTLPNL